MANPLDSIMFVNNPANSLAGYGNNIGGIGNGFYIYQGLPNNYWQVPLADYSAGVPPDSANGASGAVTNPGLSMGQGILGGLQVATDIFNAYNRYRNYKLQKQAYNFQKGLLEEQMGRQRHEWARQDKNRANITNAWNNGKSYSNSLAGSGINNNTQAI